MPDSDRPLAVGGDMLKVRRRRRREKKRKGTGAMQLSRFFFQFLVLQSPVIECFEAGSVCIHHHVC